MDSLRRFTFPLGKPHKSTCRCGRCYTKREIRTLIREHRFAGFSVGWENERFVAQKVPICFAGPVRGIN